MHSLYETVGVILSISAVRHVLTSQSIYISVCALKSPSLSLSIYIYIYIYIYKLKTGEVLDRFLSSREFLSNIPNFKTHC